VNFVSDRCKTQRESLAAASAAGAIPKTGSCPQTYDAYKKAPFPGQLSADCQKFWNVYAQDCSRQEVFLSDNCKGPREQLAREMERQAQERAAAAARARAAAQASSGGGSGSGSGARTRSRSSGGGSGSSGSVNCSDRNNFLTSPSCESARRAIQGVADANVAARTAGRNRASRQAVEEAAARAREAANYNARQAQNQRDYNNRVGTCYFYAYRAGTQTTRTERSSRRSCIDRGGTFRT
jgi:hypothetical protein